MRSVDTWNTVSPSHFRKGWSGTSCRITTAWADPTSDVSVGRVDYHSRCLSSQYVYRRAMVAISALIGHGDCLVLPIIQCHSALATWVEQSQARPQVSVLTGVMCSSSASSTLLSFPERTPPDHLTRLAIEDPSESILVCSLRL